MSGFLGKVGGASSVQSLIVSLVLGLHVLDPCCIISSVFESLHSSLFVRAAADCGALRSFICVVARCWFETVGWSQHWQVQLTTTLRPVAGTGCSNKQSNIKQRRSILQLALADDTDCLKNNLVLLNAMAEPMFKASNGRIRAQKLTHSLQHLDCHKMHLPVQLKGPQTFEACIAEP
jgi:hypothetical protein